ncbi:MAG: glycosyltransferase family 4 protein [Anaerolineae bacterium]
MNILVITPLYPPAVGGAATYFGDVMPRLAALDEIDRLTVLTERLPRQPSETVVGDLRLLRWLPRRVSGTRRRWIGHAATYLLTQLWMATQLPALVKREDADLIHFHTRYRGRLFFDALKRVEVPVIADLRDKMTDPAPLAKVADRLLCCGEGVQRFAVDEGFPAERTALIPIPFTSPDVPLQARSMPVRRRYGIGEVPFLLFLGDITYNKGAYDLLDAYRSWRTRHPQVDLIYAGANREGGRFREHIDRTPGVRYLGRVPHQDAFGLIRAAEIVVLPSRSEGLPRVILEALALGTKVICPPGIPEFERHLPEFVLPDVTPNSIVMTLDKVWNSQGVPSYPLSDHSVSHVVELLASAYRVSVAHPHSLRRS